ncbi:MAG: heterodisulfide reductase-related iron-sulfur binding cluster [Deltaproteobacteria bacterium]|nr:heterodisulfide reductase-related iron-sulfur binding cluster [Deltaproteobacteria bacterium]
MNPFSISLLLIFFLSAFALFIALKGRVLLALEPEERLDQVALRIRRLFSLAIFQKRLIGRKKERSSGIMHAFIFWGFLVLSIRSLTLVGEGFTLGFHFPFLGPDSLLGYAYLFLKDITEGIVLLMVLFAFYRRLVLKPTRIKNSPEAYLVLGMILTLMVTDLFFDAARFNLITLFQNPDQLPWFNNPLYGPEYQWTPVASLFTLLLESNGYASSLILLHFCYWLHMITLLTFLCLLPNGKHFHVITALPNVFLMSLGYPHQKARLLDLENEDAWENETLGLTHLRQLTWKQGLDLYTCTECGRCKDVCPTYVTDKPLNLKDFNDSLKHEMFGEASLLVKQRKVVEKIEKAGDKKQKDALRESLQELNNPKSLVGDIISEDTLWACTTCRACEEVCPVAIEHVPRIIGMRQSQTLMAEAYPKEMNTAFKGLERNFNPWGIGYDKRADWAEGLDIPLMSDKPQVEYLFWVGCAGSFDDRAQKVAIATAKLLKMGGVSFAILGTEEKCTGDFARRAGNEMLFQMMASENIECLNGYNIKKIITTCPHCYNTLKHEYPQMNGHYELYHHFEIIEELIASKKLHPSSKSSETTTYHDPCYLGRYNQIYQAPRNILSQVVESGVKEVNPCEKESFCCGGGGARMWMEEKIGTRINSERLSQLEKTDASQVAVGCPFCLTMLEDAVKEKDLTEKMKVKDISEIILSQCQGKTT